MSIDTFWKRVPSKTISGCGPRELQELVPSWFDDRLPIEQSEGLLVAAADTGALIEALILLGAGDGPGAPAAAAFCDGPADWDDRWMVGTLSVAVVGQVAEFLSDAPLEKWVKQHSADVAAAATTLGYRRPFDDDLATQVLHTVQKLATLFHAAAANNEAMVVRVSV
jgi:hypothetical protein